MTPILYVGNKNYSSWSLRPWLALTWAQIAFETRAVALGGEGYGHGRTAQVLAVSPSGRVPALHLGDIVVWDSLAICEWAAEAAPRARLWPEDAIARAVCRSATCEMHSGFHALRGHLPCNIRRRAPARVPARHEKEEVRQDIARIEGLWEELRGQFGRGGPYLFGAQPTIADAFYVPVASRFRTYAVPLGSNARAYVDTLLGNPAFLAWEKEATAETWTMPEWDDH
jgi:glutathione S-transferase